LENIVHSVTYILLFPKKSATAGHCHFYLFYSTYLRLELGNKRCGATGIWTSCSHPKAIIVLIFDCAFRYYIAWSSAKRYRAIRGAII